jgi:hypothetical protein
MLGLRLEESEGSFFLCNKVRDRVHDYASREEPFVDMLCIVVAF